jgi:hypothetical protein
MALFATSARLYGGGLNEPDPLVLLQGVESIREQIPSSRLHLRIVTDDAFGRYEAEYMVLFERERRYFALTNAATPERSLFDGKEVFMYDGSTGVTVRDLDSGAAHYLFDPRVLGIAALYSWGATIQGVLQLKAPQIKLVGRDQINDKPCWHVGVARDDGWQFDFWVDAQGTFAVLRRDEKRQGYAHRSTRSFYENPDYRWLPSRVECEEYDPKGQLLWRREVSVLTAKAKVKIPDTVWTLEGLLSGLPLLEWLPVTDVRTPNHSRLIGYWHKGRLGPPAPWEKAPDPPKLTPKRILLISIMALLAVAPAVAFAYRNRSRRASHII